MNSAHVGAGDQVLLLVGPGELELHGGPLPVGGVAVGYLLEPGVGEFQQEIQVEDGEALVVEQPVLAGAAGCRVGVEVHEAGGRGVGTLHALVEGVAYVVRAHASAGAQGLEGRALEVDIGGDGERLRRVEVHLSGAVGGEDFVGQAAEAQALLHGAFAHAEARSNVQGGSAFVGETAERAHLVGRVHGDADGVLREGGLRGRVGIDHEARHRVVLRDVAGLGEVLQGTQPRGAGGAADVGVVLAQQAQGNETGFRGNNAGLGRGWVAHGILRNPAPKRAVRSMRRTAPVPRPGRRSRPSGLGLDGAGGRTRGWAGHSPVCRGGFDAAWGWGQRPGRCPSGV